MLVTRPKSCVLVLSLILLFSLVLPSYGQSVLTRFEVRP